MTAEQIRTYAEAVHLLAMERGNWTTDDRVKFRYRSDPTALERKASDCRAALMGARVLKALADTPDALALLSLPAMREAS
jgi:hypothetical protein